MGLGALLIVGNKSRGGWAFGASSGECLGLRAVWSSKNGGTQRG